MVSGCVLRSARVACGLALLALCACAPNSAYRTHLVDLGKDQSCQRPGIGTTGAAPLPEICAQVSPEAVKDLYELHFVEFDDQGWLFPDAVPTPVVADALSLAPTDQIEHLMTRLRFLLDQHQDLSIVVFVHGWKHNAQADDANVQEFRALLEAAGAEERDRAGPGGKPRTVVGVYVGWRGKSWAIPDPVLSLTFWARKEAARRVSIGSARELFARLRSLRTYYNQLPPDAAPGAAPAPAAAVRPPVLEQTGASSEHGPQRPRIRTLMIGHSFGGLILYAAMSGSLIESLTAQRDLGRPGAKPAPPERPADMILLINPAFEASRYEALYHVSRRYAPPTFQPPLLVSVTSTKDWATGIAFPIGRSVNTLFERDTTPEQGTAMKKTPGHIDHYLTHRLRAHPPGPAPAAAGTGQAGTPAQADNAQCPGWKSEAELKVLHGDALGQAVRLNKQLEAENAAAFFQQNLGPDHLLKPGWTRTFCGDSYLTMAQDSGGAMLPNAMVWNIQVDGDVIRNHDDVMNPVFRAFMRQLYADVSTHP
ncbi:hypothetical protein CYJ10_26175 [Cupriavidus pauculus]|uniref:Alpha/beta hydrolase n=2 Tax=Cupriavidus pauculus TaxID=82633 RepID=A0A2N5C5Z0_9BURK|nr:hypothetical protein CYJ10_26175 [Cupriavidus pauculus]